MEINCNTYKILIHTWAGMARACEAGVRKREEYTLVWLFLVKVKVGQSLLFPLPQLVLYKVYLHKVLLISFVNYLLLKCFIAELKTCSL